MSNAFLRGLVACAGLATLALFGGATPSHADPIQLVGIAVTVVPSQPCANDSVAVQFSTCACATQFTSATRDADGLVTLVVAADPSIICVRCEPLNAIVPLGRFAAGAYVQAVQVVVNYGHDGSVDSTRTMRDDLAFQVAADCGLHGVPYLNFVQIGAPGPCAGCPNVACPGDSIPVYLSGEFPDHCTQLAAVSVVPSAAASPLPRPETVRLLYRAVCGACVMVPSPWTAAVRIAPLLAGSYGLRVEAYEGSSCESVGVAPLIGATSVPFTVSDSCGGAPKACYVASFVHALGGCDASLGANQPADVVFALRTTVPLAGLQGRFAFDTPGLRITEIEAIGSAASMLLTWQPLADGASFVLVAPSGAPIVPTDSGVEPVLRVRVSADDGVPVPDHARLTPLDLVVADAHGVAVPVCSLRMPNLVIDPAAHLCRASACDFNGDGVTDVRDLVVMVHCVLDSTACPAGVYGQVDCNGDGSKDVSDVLCCARILLAGLRGGAPGQRPDPDVKVTLGAPRATSAGVDVPVTLGGLAGVGAARVDFTYPDARYDVTSVEAPAGGANGWLTLDQPNAGKLALGIVALGPDAGATLPVVVHLSLKAGQAAGGEFGLDGAEFAGQDGAALTTQVAAVSTPLAGGAAVALGAPRPNPFGATTSLSLTLPVAQAVDVGVFDLAGRRVATLFHGPAVAGTTALTWNRTRSGGASVGTGVYFIRVTTARGDSAGRKVMVLSHE